MIVVLRPLWAFLVLPAEKLNSMDPTSYRHAAVVDPETMLPILSLAAMRFALDGYFPSFVSPVVLAPRLFQVLQCTLGIRFVAPVPRVDSQLWGFQISAPPPYLKFLDQRDSRKTK